MYCSRKQPKTFAFDHCFYSLDPALNHFASQKTVFECLGCDILDNAFDGYNACIFAYGQTGEYTFSKYAVVMATITRRRKDRYEVLIHHLITRSRPDLQEWHFMGSPKSDWLVHMQYFVSCVFCGIYRANKAAQTGGLQSLAPYSSYNK